MGLTNRHASFFITLEEERAVCAISRLENIHTVDLLHRYFREGLEAHIQQLKEEEKWVTET